MQYTEAPPVLVFNTNPPYPTAPTAPLWQIPALTPRVEFTYLTSLDVRESACRDTSSPETRPVLSFAG